MNVNTNGPHAPRPSDRYRDAMDSLVLRTRNRLAHARRDAAVNLPPNTSGTANSERVRQDTVEISNQPNEVGRDITNDEVVRPKIARLKHMYRTGQLFKPETLERAAHALLQRHHDNPPNVPNVPNVPNTESGPQGSSSLPMAPKPNTESGPSKPNTESMPMQPKVAPPAVKTFMKPTSFTFSPYTGPQDVPNTASGPNTDDDSNPGSGGPNL